jgi:hypothetical protein
MEGKVSLSVYVSHETRKILKKMAVNQEKTMANLLEEMIIMKWQEVSMNKKDGII